MGSEWVVSSPVVVLTPQWVNGGELHLQMSPQATSDLDVSECAVVGCIAQAVHPQVLTLPTKSGQECGVPWSLLVRVEPLSQSLLPVLALLPWQWACCRLAV